MKHILTQIFVTLGVIFLILIIISVYFFVADPYNLRPLLFKGGNAPAQTNTNTNGSTSETKTSTGGGFQLSEGQKQALVSFGIDPATVPSSISAEQEQCFVNALGAGRVQEIKDGAVPGAFEFLKAKSCI